MKKFIFLVLLLTLPTISWTEEKILSSDGYTWESWSKGIKVGWAAGFYDGIEQGTFEGGIFLWAFEDIMKNRYQDSNELEFIKNKLGRSLGERTSFEFISFGQIVNGLDEFYKDFRNKTIEIREAAYMVRLELKGAPKNFIEEQIRIIRIPWENRQKEQQSLLANDLNYKKNWENWDKYMPIGVSGSLFDLISKEE